MTINLQAAGALEKYEAERKKRTGVANFVQTVSTRNESLADLGRDPWADYDALANETPALSDGDDVQFVIVGGGHNGIIFAAELIKAGFSPDRLVIVDEAGGFGGTWYWNRYPGLTCDVESYCYLPLLEDTGFVPKHRYSRGEEIRENAERIVQKFGIRAMFCTRLLSADWDESLKRWVLCLRRNLGPAYKDLNRDFVVHTQFFIPACGPLNILSAPNLPGLDKFRRTRTMFHTARWDYDYTGGTQENPEMVNLGDKVVGIIGTGATSVQVTPELAKYAKHVYVFQRTPSYVGPRTQLETTPEVWAKVVAPGPGWQLARQQNLDGFLSDDPALTEDDDLLKDGWSRARSFAGLIGSPRARNQDLSSPDDISAHLKAMVDRELPISEGLRAHVRQVVKDPDTAAKLTAWYPGWCKRPTFHQYYLQCFNQPNVTLVDTDGQGVQAYTEKGVVVGTGKNAKEYELDALVLATGFSQEKGLALGSSGAPIRGRGGLEINEKMEAGGALFLGVAAPGFPNMFFSLSVGATASANTTTTYTTSSRVVTELLRRRAAGDDRAVVEADAEATARYTDLVAQKLGWFAGFTVCPPNYFTRYKDVTPGKTGRDGVWPYGPVDFRKHVDEYIHAGDFTGFNVSA